MTSQTIPAGYLHAGHIGMTVRGADMRGREVHAELRQIYHTSSETFINTNPLDFDPLRDGCGAVDEWLFDANEEVTLDGLPDLPRLEWPGTEKSNPALPGGWRLADHPFYGRVIVTKTTPSRDGHTYFVCPSKDRFGFDWSFCDHSELTYLPQ